MNRSVFALSMIVLAAFVFAQPVSAALTSVITDPVGDAVLFPPPVFNPDNPQILAEPFQDIVQVAITLKDGRFTFAMELAGPIPDSPTVIAGTVQPWWQWTLDTDPTTFPAGFPFTRTDARPAEFFVLMLWDGTSFAGIVIDRRPLLTGPEATITSVPFTIKGAEVTLSVDSAILGTPSSFGWFSVTRCWLGPLGTEAEFVVDSVGGPFNLIAWPPP